MMTPLKVLATGGLLVALSFGSTWAQGNGEVRRDRRRDVRQALR